MRRNPRPLAPVLLLVALVLAACTPGGSGATIAPDRPVPGAPSSAPPAAPAAPASIAPAASGGGYGY